MAGFEGDELAPAQAGLDRGLDHEPVPLGECGDRSVVLGGGQGAGLAAITLGSSVWSHGLWTRTRSLTARPKIEDSSMWYFWIDRGESPSAEALVTQSWTSEGGCG